MIAPRFARQFLVGGMLLFSPSVFAARLAVLPPKVESESSAPVKEARRSKMHDAFSQGLTETMGSDWTALSSEEIRQRLAGKDDLLACQQGDCIKRVASQVQVDRVVVVTVSMKNAASGTAYQFRLAAIDPAGKVREVSHAGRCGDDSDGCNWNGALDAMRKTGAELWPKVLASAAPAVATSPVEKLGNGGDKAATGSAAQPDATSVPVVTTVRAANPTTNDAAPTAPAVRHLGYRYGWIASGIVAIGLVVTSVPFLVLSPRDGQITCTDGRPANQCPTRYSGNLATGLGLLGGGVAAATVAGVLFYFDRRDLKRSQNRVAAVPMWYDGGGGVTLLGRF
jgi:hypothetical protein